MTQFIMLLKKEWWDWRSTVLILLTSLVIIFALLNTSYWVRVKNGEENVRAGNYEMLEDREWGTQVWFIEPLVPRETHIRPRSFENYEKFLQHEKTEFSRLYLQLLRIFMSQGIWIIGFVVSFVLASSFYKEQRNGTVLYMKSLPVDDARIIAAKLICGLLVFFCLGVIIGLFFLIISKVGISMAGSALARVLEPYLSIPINLTLFWKWMQFMLFYTFISAPILLLILLFSMLARRIHPFILVHCINGLIIVMPFFLNKFLGVDAGVISKFGYKMVEGELMISFNMNDAGLFILAYFLPVFWANEGINLGLMDAGYFSHFISLPMFLYILLFFLFSWLLLKAYKRTIRSI